MVGSKNINEKKIKTAEKTDNNQGISASYLLVENLNKELGKNKTDMTIVEEEFLSKAEIFINSVISTKGYIKPDKFDFPVFSFAIEFIEKSKIICRKKELLFHEKVLETVRDIIHNYDTKKLSFLQVSVLLFMKDLLNLDKGSLYNDSYQDLQKHFYKIKDMLSDEYNAGEW